MENKDKTFNFWENVVLERLQNILNATIILTLLLLLVYSNFRIYSLKERINKERQQVHSDEPLQLETLENVSNSKCYENGPDNIIVVESDLDKYVWLRCRSID